jgi:hypothetical protein
MSLPLDPFGRSTLPATLTREAREQLIGQAAVALLRGELPHPAARIFVAGALSAWLQHGG